MNATVRNSIIGVIIAGIGGIFFTAFNSISDNTYFSKQHTKEIKEIKEKINTLENNQNKMSDIYVTRRELNIIMDNIESNTNNINKSINSIDNKLERLTDKIYKVGG